ncbi:MAG: hypothetical protein H6707_18370 [Deltaproteobacteria bacterium]|nr:hypothetical protein [Deltaproteobacteria bacterium]
MSIVTAAIALLVASGCSEETATCHYDGKTYNAGQSFAAVDKCNTCSCDAKAGVMCTAKACDGTPLGRDECRYDGKTYKKGDVFAATDGCNSCSCMPEGSTGVGCTIKLCLTDAGVPDGANLHPCGKEVCTPGRVCVHPCCGGTAPPCIDMPDAGVCPAGFVPGCPLGCTGKPCTPPPPYCTSPDEVPNNCDYLGTTPLDRMCGCA